MFFFNNYLTQNKRVKELLEKYEINFETNIIPYGMEKINKNL